MAYPKRHLTRRTASFAFFFWLSACAFAQSAPPVTFRTLAAGNSPALTGLFYESQGRSVPIQAGPLNLSPAYPAPDGGRLVVYREIPPVPPETNPKRIVVAETTLGKEGPCLVVLAATASKVAAVTFDDSWASQSEDSVRILNFSRRRTAIQLESNTAELNPAQDQVLPLRPGSHIADLKIAVLENNDWLLASNSPPAIIPRTRLIILITDMPPTPENPRPAEVDIWGVYDSSPPPRPAQDSAARASAKPARPAA